MPLSSVRDRRALACGLVQVIFDVTAVLLLVVKFKILEAVSFELLKVDANTSQTLLQISCRSVHLTFFSLRPTFT